MTSKAKINPEMMRWAREYAGYVNGYEKTLPKDIQEKIDDWESGKNYPTWNQLRAISKKYGLPSAFFFMKKPPSFETMPDLTDYRKTDNPIYARYSPELIRNIRRSERRREIHIDALSEDNPKFEVPNLKRNKTSICNHIQNTLDIAPIARKSLSDDLNHNEFFNNWKDILSEKFAILIYESENVDINEMRGLCIFHEENPIILLNGNDNPTKKTFTLFHELTHLLLGESAICGNEINHETETFCNIVAGEFVTLVSSKSDDKNH